MRSYLIRFMSFFYDALLSLAIAFVAGFCFIYLLGDATHGVKRYLFAGYIYLCLGAYFVYCWVQGGQTLGMKTWRLQLQTITAKPISKGVAVKRYLLATVSLSFLGLGFLWRLIDGDKQYLHDRLLGLQLNQH